MFCISNSGLDIELSGGNITYHPSGSEAEACAAKRFKFQNMLSALHLKKVPLEAVGIFEEALIRARLINP